MVSSHNRRAPLALFLPVYQGSSRWPKNQVFTTCFFPQLDSPAGPDNVVLSGLTPLAEKVAFVSMFSPITPFPAGPDLCLFSRARATGRKMNRLVPGVQECTRRQLGDIATGRPTLDLCCAARA
jgi:hypothetical protein